MFEQERVIVRLQQQVLREPDILVCFLTGSHGRRAQDAYSDLDVTLVFANEDSRAAAYSRRRQFVQSVLPYVPAKSFDAEQIRPYFHIALYSNGTKVDYLYENQETLTPTPWTRDIRLLKDSNGWGEQFQAAAGRIPAVVPQPTISAEVLSELDNRFWVMFWDAYRLLLRGDYDKPFTVYLQLTYFSLPELLRLLPPEDPAYQGLIRLYFSHDTRATAEHMRQLFDAYLAAREAIVRRHSLIFTPDQSFERAVRKLIQRGG